MLGQMTSHSPTAFIIGWENDNGHDCLTVALCTFTNACIIVQDILLAQAVLEWSMQTPHVDVTSCVLWATETTVV